MLQVSDRVYQRFAVDSRDQFEDRALHFLAGEFPDALAMSGEQGLRRAIRTGQQRAILIGFETERSVIKYLVLQHIFGADVDVNPAYPEITVVLNDKRRDPEARIDQAIQLASRRLDAKAGA